MDWIELIHAALSAGRPVALATLIESPDRPELTGRHLLLGEEGLLASELAGDPREADLVRAAGEALRRGSPLSQDGIYAEPCLPPPALLVAGAGHIAQPLAEIGKLAGFHVTVIDDRAEYANPARFPTADAVLCDQFTAAIRAVDPGRRHYAVLVTRGHRQDLTCLRELIGRPLPYIGMIGSQSRVRTVFRLLEEEGGLSPAQRTNLYAPIGLDLGARSPGGIAVAVIAEILKVMHGGSGESLSGHSRGRIHGGEIGVGWHAP